MRWIRRHWLIQNQLHLKHILHFSEVILKSTKVVQTYLIGAKASPAANFPWIFLTPVPPALGRTNDSKPLSTGCLTPIEICWLGTSSSPDHEAFAFGTRRRAIDAARITEWFQVTEIFTFYLVIYKFKAQERLTQIIQRDRLTTSLLQFTA